MSPPKAGVIVLVALFCIFIGVIVLVVLFCIFISVLFTIEDATMQIGILVTNNQELAEAADLDFDYIEGFPGLLGPDEDDAKAEAQCLAKFDKHRLRMKSMCGFIPDPQGRGLMVVGPDVSMGRLRAFVTRVFDRMQRAGVEVIGYGSGGSRWVPDGFDPDRARQQVADFMHLCADLGEPRNVKVALEPYNRDDANLLNTVAEATQFIETVDRSHAQLMADFFHMMLNGESFDTLEAAAPHLIHAHIAEPGRGRPETTPADHARFLQALRRFGYDGRVTLSGALAAYADDGETAIALKGVIA